MIKKPHHYGLAILLSICSLAVIVAAFGYYVLGTPSGGRKLIDYLLLQSAKYGSLTIGEVQGNIAQGLVLRDIDLKNWVFWGPTATVHIQRVDLRLPLNFDTRKVYVKFFNGRLDLANSEAFVFNGEYNNGELLGNAYSRSLDVAVLMKPFLLEDVMRSLHGQVSDADFIFQGPIFNLQTRGHFYVEHIQYGTTILKNALTRFVLSFPYEQGKWQMKGPLTIENGLVNVRRSTIELAQSRALFKGDVLNPDLMIAGTAKADVYTIDLKIFGTLLNPKVEAKSEPYLPQDMVLMVLGLGDWAPSQFSADNDEGFNKMGLKKKITDDFKLGFLLEELPSRQGVTTGYSKQIEGELSITDKFSLNLAEKIAPDRTDVSGSSGQTKSRSQGESKFYLKYKNTF